MSWLSVLPRSNNKATCTCKQTNSQSRPHAHQLAAAHAWTHERTTNTCMGKQASRKQACAAETKTRNIEPQAHMRRSDINTSMRGHAVVTTVTRVVNDWNALPSHMVSALTVNQFKARLDSHWVLLQYTIPYQDCG